MKRICTALVLCGALFVVGSSARAQSGPQMEKAILDSLEVLKGAGGFVDGYGNPPTAEELRYNAIVRMLFSLRFERVRLLLKDSNKFARACGFLVAAKKYPQRLSAGDLEITKDTSSLPMYTPQGNVDMGFTLGRYCTMAYQSGLEEARMYPRESLARQSETMRSRTEAAVRAFIKASAGLPESYRPGTFSGFSWSSSTEDTFYIIRHQYRLKNRLGRDVAASDYFVLDRSFSMMIIEKTQSGMLSADPPMTMAWRKDFGKE